jgi:hypothetical protein
MDNDLDNRQIKTVKQNYNKKRPLASVIGKGAFHY